MPKPVGDIVQAEGKSVCISPYIEMIVPSREEREAGGIRIKNSRGQEKKQIMQFNYPIF